VIVATAHPAKFDEIVEPLIGARVPVPESLAEILARPRIERQIAARPEQLHQALLEYR
jgi:threonine synthase